MKIIHPFSNTSSAEIEVESAEGYYVQYDNEKKLDFISGLYNCPLGYSEQKLKNAIHRASNELPNSHVFAIHPELAQTNKYAVALTKKLKKLVYFGKYISYTNSGSEAVDLAIRYAWQKDKDINKSKIISYKTSYHGSTSLTGSVSGNLNIDKHDRVYVDFYGYDKQYTKEEYISNFEKTILDNGPNTILCFVAESMIGSSGGFLMKENVLPELFEICKKYSIVTILDEVISGFGRLGEMFAFEKYNVKPDVLALSKQLTNGYLPMGCCILSDSFDLTNTPIMMGYTMSANPITCAVAIEMIDLIPDRSSTESELKILLEKIKGNTIVYAIEHAGCFAAIHFSKSINKLEYFDFNIGGKIAEVCFNTGLIIRGNPKSIIFAPGYNMSREQFDDATSILLMAINNVQEKL